MNSVNTKGLLQVYTASAGSGKTYTLSREFIALALENPLFAYSNILAVTFTKKATEEMKSRIIEELSLLKGKEASSMEADLCKSLHIQPQELKQRAEKSLKMILSDYSAFKVKTIDSFFEEIVRSFASEIGHQSNYRIELDNDYRLHKGVLMLFNDLASREKEDIYKCISSIAGEGIEKGERYNILPRIEDIGKQLFASSQLQGDNRAIVPDATLIAILQKEIKLLLDQPPVGAEKPTAKVKSEEHLLYNSLKCIDADLPLLATLNDIDEAMKEEGLAQNSMLLFSSQTLINKILSGGNSDASFLYERTGSKIHHFMIDEFQDTSRLQYDNLKPLFDNSLASGNKNLIVGDVKQSIYKFRHCDRTILQDLIPEDFKTYIESQVLDKNWRSVPEIVQFNNELFKQLPQLVAGKLKDSISSDYSKAVANEIALINEDTLNGITQSITDTYAEVEQKAAHGNKSGGVEYILVDKDCSPLIGNEGSSPEICSKIVELIAKGYEPRDIAVLVNTNRQVGEVAATFLQFASDHPEHAQSFKFTSSEALKLSNSSVVGLLIDLLTALADKRNKTARGIAALRYKELAKTSTDKDFDELFDLLEKEIAHSNLSTLIGEMVKHIAPLVQESESAYVMTFLDVVETFRKDNYGSITSFVEWWHTRGYKQDLPVRDENAISIMTIHKAKGLGFPIVLLPFLTWNLGFAGRGGRAPYLWVTIPQNIISGLNQNHNANQWLKVPVKRTKDLGKTSFAVDYYEEMVKETIDRLNLFYVAATRAKKGMVLWVQKPTNKDQDKPLLHSLLYSILWGEPGDNLLPYTSIPNKGNTESRTVSLNNPQQIPSFQSYMQGSFPNLRVRMTAKNGFKDEKYIENGRVLHDILSRITTPETLKDAVNGAISEGIIDESRREAVIRSITSIVQHPYGKRWFAPDITVWNEQTIVRPNSIHLFRPDRVVMMPDKSIAVIDYKFAQPSEKHKNQVAAYCILIKEMGFTNVAGFLWYPLRNTEQIIEVYPYSETSLINS